MTGEIRDAIDLNRGWLDEPLMRSNGRILTVRQWLNTSILVYLVCLPLFYVPLAGIPAMFVAQFYGLLVFLPGLILLSLRHFHVTLILFGLWLALGYAAIYLDEGRFVWLVRFEKLLFWPQHWPLW